MPCGCLQSVVESKYRRYVCLKKPTGWYSEALQLERKVRDKAVASESIAAEDGLSIIHPDSDLLARSENQDALSFTESAAVREMKNTKK